MVPCLRCSARIWGETNHPIHILQAFVVAGGWNAWTQAGRLSSVLALLPGETWTPLASLPKALYTARASVVGGRLRVTGGRHGVTYRSEVMVKRAINDTGELVH